MVAGRRISSKRRQGNRVAAASRRLAVLSIALCGLMLSGLMFRPALAITTDSPEWQALMQAAKAEAATPSTVA